MDAAALKLAVIATSASPTAGSCDQRRAAAGTVRHHVIGRPQSWSRRQAVRRPNPAPMQDSGVAGPGGVAWETIRNQC